MKRRRASQSRMSKLLWGPVFAGLAAPALAQSGDPLEAVRAAMTRLAYDDAYAQLAAIIASDPASPAPYLERARLHQLLGRPGLALADLDRARAAGLASPEADALAAEIWLDNDAPAEAIAAFDAMLAVRPDDPAALAGRAEAHARAGLLGNALADYDRAIAHAPDDAALVAARDALLERLEQSAVARITFAPEAVLEPAFRIDEGEAGAAHRLVIVEAGDDLAPENARPDPAALARAIAAGDLRVTRLFTYTGSDASIWANLALICGGIGGFEALRPSLSDAAGRAALTAADASGDLTALRRLVEDAYGEAGVPAGQAETCAFDRGRALAYLAEWSAKRESVIWRGVNFYDNWPVYVWDDTPVALADLNSRLAALAPPGAADAPTPTAGEVTPPESEPAPETVASEQQEPAQVATSFETGEATQAPSIETDVEADTSGETVSAEPTLEAPPAREIVVAETTPTDPTAQDQTPPESPVIDAPAEERLQGDAGEADTEDAAPASGGAEETAALVESGEAGADAVPVTTDDEDVQETGAGIEETASTNLQTESENIETRPEAPTAEAPGEHAGMDVPLDEAVNEGATPPPASDLPPLPPAPPVTAEGRVPAVLRGVYAPSLVDCIAYTDRVEAAETLDALLPPLNPLDGPPIGTVMLTSGRMQLFNLTDTECGLTALGGEHADTPWRAELTCANALAPDVTTPLALTRLEAEGPAPRLSAALGTAPAVELVQCLPLGRLGRDAEPLWRLDTEACAARAPVTGADFVFEAGAEGALTMSLRPEAAPEAAAGMVPRLVLDGAEWQTPPARWEDGGWRFALGPFAEASRRLSLGLFLDVVGDEPVASGRLPLLGSSATMSGLADCAPAPEDDR